MGLIIFLVYLLACALVGYLGRKQRIGFWGFFLVSVFVTPLPAAFAAVLAENLQSTKPR